MIVLQTALDKIQYYFNALNSIFLSNSKPFADLQIEWELR